MFTESTFGRKKKRTQLCAKLIFMGMVFVMIPPLILIVAYLFIKA